MVGTKSAAQVEVAFARHRWEEAAAWRHRLRNDAIAARRMNRHLWSITRALLTAAVDMHALSFAVTGSTALDRRTQVSDVDFYVVGKRPDLPDSDEEIDIYAIEVKEFERRLECGDDYLQWTLRFGLILHDLGPFQWAVQRVAREQLWPDPRPKWVQARRATQMASAILRTGDDDAALEQCRIAFTLAARWWLLSHGEFPRARSDLPEQLSKTGFSWLGDVLRRTIFEEPSTAVLAWGVEQLQRELDDASAIPPSGVAGSRSPRSPRGEGQDDG